MGLFKKKEEKKIEEISEELPELPRLPELPELRNFENSKQLPQLPSFPQNSIGKKFSQYSIKDAVAGEEEDIEEVEADEFNDDKTMLKPLKTIEIPAKQESLIARRIPARQKEPVFVRIDKFQESLETFEKAKEKIGEIEKILEKIKQVKEEEARELIAWETEIQKMKSQIEKVDKDIFSKLE